MGTEVLERRFATIGARLNVVGRPVGAPRIDVGRDTRGEFFDVRFAGTGRLVELEVVDVSRVDRHLLLLVRDGEEKSKFLCGYDERHWFVAAVPEDARGVTGVAAAKAALQPAACPDGGRPGTAEGSVPPSQRRVRSPGRVVLRPGARARPTGGVRASRRAADAWARHGPRDAVRVSHAAARSSA